MSVLQSQGVIPPSQICKRGEITLDTGEDTSWMLKDKAEVYIFVIDESCENTKTTNDVSSRQCQLCSISQV